MESLCGKKWMPCNISEINRHLDVSYKNKFSARSYAVYKQFLFVLFVRSLQ